MDARVRKHWKELTKSAIKVHDVLQEMYWYNPGARPVICELTVDFDERDVLETLDNEADKLLLTHIQVEFPKLCRFSSWKYLKLTDITPGLLDYLSYCIKTGEFQGKCKMCEKRE